MTVSRRHIGEEEQLQVERLARRLQGSVTVVDILNWLENFRQDERADALELASALEFISEKHLLECMDESVKQLLNACPSDITFVLLPLGGYGKSGTLLTYYLKKCPTYDSHSSRFILVESPSALQQVLDRRNTQTHDRLVVLDDFLGSGESMEDFYDLKLVPVINGTHVDGKDTFILAAHYMEAAMQLLAPKIPHVRVFGKLRTKCFSRRNSPFGSRARNVELRELAYRYGQQLEYLRRDALGFGNSQALLVYPYNAPDNTLTIFWSNNYCSEISRNWIPLYPRDQPLRISEAKDARKRMAMELGLLRFADQDIVTKLRTGTGDLGWKSFNFITREDFRLYAYMRLTRQRRATSIVRALLGITESDIEQIIKIGEERGLLTPGGALTDEGLRVYGQGLKTLRKMKADFLRAETVRQPREVIYVPKMFNGKTRQHG
ncbi:MAG: phosphoribosyltransferase-like protein [Flavobacteriales bacterium]